MADRSRRDSAETADELQSVLATSHGLVEGRIQQLGRQLQLLVVTGKFGAAVPLAMSLIPVGMTLDLHMHYSNVPPGMTLYTVALAGLGVMVSSRLEKRYLSFIPGLVKKREQSERLRAQLMEASDALAGGEENPQDIKTGVLRLLKESGIEIAADGAGKR